MKENEIIFINSIFFVIGFVVIFSLLGILLQTLLSGTAHILMKTLNLIGGTIIIIFGILLLLSTKYLVPIFSQEYRFHVKKLRNRYASSLIFGATFAICWTPCVGPILGAIYALAITTPNLGFLLLLSYSFGLAIPFLIFGAFISKLSGFKKRINPFLKYFNIISGISLIVLGLLVVTGYIGLLSVFLVNNASSYIPFSASSLNLIIAMIAGFLTFLSPCILPILPAYFAYMSGGAMQEADT